MRVLFLLTTLLIGIQSISQEIITKEDVKFLKNELPRNLIIKPDYIEKVIWIKTPKIYVTGIVKPFSLSTYSPDLTHVFYFRVTKNENGEFVRNGLRYAINYSSSNWLFVEKMMIRTASTNKETRQGLGTEYNVIFNEDKADRDVRMGGINEKFDIYNNQQILAWLKDIKDTHNFTRLRIYGDKGYKDSAIKQKHFRPLAWAILDAMSNELFIVNE